MTEVTPGIYRHFKGELVRVLHVATHSESLEKMVVYIALYGCRTGGIGSIWVRPMEMFMQNVERDGETFPRFQKLSEVPEHD